MAIATMWASMTTWFTPTVLFCVTNLIIAIIFIVSNNNKNNNHNHHQEHTISLSRISRVSSFLHRSTSINSSSYSTTTVESQHQYPPQPKTATYSSSSRLAQSINLASDDYELSPSEPEGPPLSQPDNSPGQLVRAPSFLDRVKSFRIASAFDFGANSSQPETVSTDPGHSPDPEHNVIRSKSEKKPAKKSSVKMKKSRSEMRISGSDGEDVDLRRPATARERQRPDDVDEEVDARADDFICRFKQQLKLQRLESLVRYKEMLNRRS